MWGSGVARDRCGDRLNLRVVGVVDQVQAVSVRARRYVPGSLYRLRTRFQSLRRGRSQMSLRGLS